MVVADGSFWFCQRFSMITAYSKVHQHSHFVAYWQINSGNNSGWARYKYHSNPQPSPSRHPRFTPFFPSIQEITFVNKDLQFKHLTKDYVGSSKLAWFALCVNFNPLRQLSPSLAQLFGEKAAQLVALTINSHNLKEGPFLIILAAVYRSPQYFFSKVCKSKFLMCKALHKEDIQFLLKQKTSGVFENLTLQ